MSLRIPLLPRADFLFLLGNDGPPTPPELRQVRQRPPTSLEKCTFTKNNYQSKEQGDLA